MVGSNQAINSKNYLSLSYKANLFLKKDVRFNYRDYMVCANREE
jgi:hypothetical protein